MEDPAFMWAVGLIEGEGSFVFGKYPQSQGRGGMWTHNTVQVKTTDEYVVRRLQDLLGGTVAGPHSNKAKAHWKPTWQWVLQKRPEVFALATRLLPHLSPRRQQQAQRLLDGINSLS